MAARVLLKKNLHLTAAKRVTVHCPASDAAQAAFAAGNLQRLEFESPFDALFSVLRNNIDFGRIGPYRSVFELSLGQETFVPGPGADPSTGTLDKRTCLATIVITTYLAAETSAQRLAELVAMLAAAHPWELPVIEVATVDLLK